MPASKDQERHDRRRADRIAAGLVVGFVLCAIVRAVSAKPIESPPAATEAQKRAAFSSMAGNERKMRRDAAHDFPADPWSQDDAFHNFEFKEARSYGEDHKMRLPDVLAAIDQGMHDHWPMPRGAAFMNPSVPPCRPRPIH